MSRAETTAGPSSDGRLKGVYTAAAANRASQIADWISYRVKGEGEIDELAYASGKNLIIVRSAAAPHPSPAQVIVTRHGRLTALKFAYPVSGSGVPRLLAASSDGWLYLFKRDPEHSTWSLQHQWQAIESVDADSAPIRNTQLPAVRKTIKTSGASVRALGVIRKSYQSAAVRSDRYVFASATSDGSLQIWTLDGDEGVRRHQDISLGRSRAETRTEVLPLDIAIARLPHSNDALLLAVAGTDAKVDMMLAENGGKFQRLFSLLGHTDWVRSLDFCYTRSGQDAQLLLASASQDHGVRLWRIEQVTTAAGQQQAPVPLGEMDDFDKLASQIEEGEDEAIATKMMMFNCADQRWIVSFDALLIGHEHWVTGVRWAPLSGDVQPAALLSSSADNSVILWTPSSCVTQAMSSLDLPPFAAPTHVEEGGQHTQDVWVAVQRFGEVGNVGSAANGMYGVSWRPTVADDGRQQAVMAHGYGGAVHIWSRTIGDHGHAQPWRAEPGHGGHFAPATCVRWEAGGQYLISGGMDKTTRLHGCFRNGQGESWHQMSRPQTHGYEIMALAWLSRLAFASAGDEKIVRVFEAPQGFIRSAENLKLIRSEKQPNTLAFYLPDTAHVLHPEHLARTIKEATRRSLHRGSLDIVVVSDLFQGVERNEALKVSFEQVETFLKWCYAQAWSEAVDADELLFDVDVMLLGTELAVDRLRDHHQGGECFIAKKAENALPFDIPGAIPLQTDDGEPHDQSNSQSSFPQHAAIAMGGTFDHLHVGHKILLSMACLLATERVVIGVTDDSMLSKKKHASVLESTQERIDRVASFMTKFCNMVGRTALKHEVVVLQDVAGPAGTDANLTALLFTDETVGGADFIDKEREKRGLKKLDRFTIGLIGASGETDVQGKDAGELAAAKVGSTAIRGWLEKRLEGGKDRKVVLPAKQLPDLNQIPTLNGEPRPVGASVPPLGLSNRAIYGAGNEPLDGPSETGQPIGKAIRSIAQHLTRPPVEEELHNHSLWSEVTKLYGHPLELLALDVDSSSGLVASSCKATQAELAGVRLHDSRQGWKEVQCLLGHALGVTRLRFNAQGDRLVTVSRDRSWRMYRRKKDVDSGQEPFELECVGQEAHSRIIYDVAWIDDERFATASRDKTVKIWQTQREGHPINALVTLILPGPVTAVAVQPKRRAMAIGLESGAIHTYLADTHESWQHRIATGDLHADALSELAWQPNANEQLMLASASEDGMIRLTEIVL